MHSFDPREQHYSVLDIATAWSVDPSTIRRLFGDRDDVIKIYKPRRRTRRYVTLRIPHSTMERVREEMARG